MSQLFAAFLGGNLFGRRFGCFNQIFLDAVRERGRIFELGLMLGFKLRTKRLFEDVDKAPMMLLKGKLPLSAPRVAGKDEREALFGRAAATTPDAGAATTLPRSAKGGSQ